LLTLAILLLIRPGYLEKIRQNVGLLYFTHALNLEFPWPDMKEGREDALLRAARWLSAASQEEAVSYPLGTVYALAGEETEATDTWRQGTGIVPKLLEFGKRAYRMREYEVAIQWFQRAARVEPDNRDPWYYLGLAYAGRGDLHQSIESFTTGLSRSWGRETGTSDLYFQIGHTKRHRIHPPDFQGAWEAHQKAIELDDFKIKRHRAEALYQIGTILEWRGKWQDAIESYQKALSVNPSHYSAQMGLARIYKRRGDISQSIETYRKAVRIQPRNKRAYIELGLLYKEIGRYDLATRALCQASMLDPNDRHVKDLLDEIPNANCHAE